MTFGMEVRGTNRVANKYRGAASRMPSIIDRVIGDWSKLERRLLKGTPYPTRPLGSTYIRTGNLANRFYARKLRDGVWIVGNSANYARFVISDKQAWMHKNRWWKMSDESAKRTPNLVRDLTNTIIRELE